MAAHATRHPTLDLPRPVRSAAPLAALALVAALLEADRRLPWLAAAVAAVCFAAAAAVRAARARLELEAVRRTADRLIVYEPHRTDASELVLWRSEELTSPETRERLRREYDRTLGMLAPGRLPSASPLRRPAARANAELLRRIAARVGDTRPVSARGILLARSLLRDAGSPLYADDADVLLPRALRRVLGALEP